MPAQNKSNPPRKPTPPGSRPNYGTYQPPVVHNAAAPTPAGYTHFSDKLTGALMNISNVIDDNKSTLDSIQDMSIQLTRTVKLLREVVMKYVEMADNVLETIVPIMEKLPIFPDKVKDFAKDLLELSQKITAASELAEKVLPGVEASLMSADIAGLQNSTGDVAQLTRALQEIIPAGAH